MIEKILESLAQKFAGRIVTKLVTMAAAALLTHGLLKPEAQAGWIAANAEWLTGLALTALSAWLSTWQQKKTELAKQVAAYSPAPTEPPPAVVKAELDRTHTIPELIQPGDTQNSKP